MFGALWQAAVSRRMSVSLTLDAVKRQEKTVTRRHVDTWRTLRAGDRLTLIEKGMGLPKGARQVAVAEVEVVDVRVETLRSITADEVRREGLWHEAVLGGMAPAVAEYADPEDAPVTWFRRFWARSHGYGDDPLPQLGIPCRRIEWRYLVANENATPDSSTREPTSGRSPE